MKVNRVGKKDCNGPAMMLHADRKPPIVPIKHICVPFAAILFPTIGEKKKNSQNGIIQNHSHKSVKGR